MDCNTCVALATVRRSPRKKCKHPLLWPRSGRFGQDKKRVLLKISFKTRRRQRPYICRTFAVYLSSYVLLPLVAWTKLESNTFRKVRILRLFRFVIPIICCLNLVHSNLSGTRVFRFTIYKVDLNNRRRWLRKLDGYFCTSELHENKNFVKPNS